jgi:hypothetical protein
MELKIYYSVRNGGDGSAYPTFMESLELAEWDQEHMSEGWGESCTGSLILQSDSPITCKTKIVNKESYLIDKYFDNFNPKNKEMIEFIENFFSKGLPNFTIILEDLPNKPKEYNYVYNKIYVDGVEVARIFKNKNESGEVFQNNLNNIATEIEAKKYNI